MDRSQSLLALLIGCAAAIEFSSVAAAGGALERSPSDRAAPQFIAPDYFTIDVPPSAWIENWATGLASRIINGDPIKRIRARPYAASLFVASPAGLTYICGGTVLSGRVVLTAAHCLGGEGQQYVVCAGATHIRRYKREGGCTAVHKVVRPTNFRKYRPLQGWDLAVVRTEGDLRRAGARAIAVSFDHRYNQLPRRGLRAHALGFGVFTRHSARFDGRLRKMDAKVVDRYFYRPVYSEEHLLTVYGDFDGSRGGVCYGDSGGPLVVRRRRGGSGRRVDVVIGVASAAFVTGDGQCMNNRPSMHTRLAHPAHRAFIRRAMRRLRGRLMIDQGPRRAAMRRVYRIGRAQHVCCESAHVPPLAPGMD